MTMPSSLMAAFGFGAGPTPEQVRKAAVAANHDAFKAAVREGDIPAIEQMFSDRRITLGDELDRGRGLLQFAVITNAVKAVRFLVARGANVTSADTLGASAAKLGRSNGTDAMARALEAKALPTPAV